ncbi:helix-turn-helix transcriptional regulator [Salmonella enterica]|nr:helix-turn-helix transcriptional regulator [Salmonella enterica]EGT2786630.1 helix-turn-helix transcriptional regulator [Salmonella enterica subsp. enterica serovar Carmel]EDH1765340.1 hypothetical protein [Salmonella enterica]EIC5002076.1 helix-turn-helix transcriptional regulator [Salmonella enterica]EIJ3932372.1 helix-turn-helix transcriptional regulator [Salmonella enterica]
MNQLFLVSSCGFTRAGLEALSRDWKMPTEVLSIRHPGQILSAPPVSGNRLVLVSVPAESVAEAARGMLFWRQMELMRLEPAGAVFLRDVPCVLLGERSGRVLPEGSLWLSPAIPPAQLGVYLQQILRNAYLMVPECRNRNQLHLSQQQRAVMAACMSGEAVRETAVRLGLSTHAVNCSRYTVMQRLGLRNRLELMSLSGSDVE